MKAAPGAGFRVLQRSDGSASYRIRLSCSAVPSFPRKACEKIEITGFGKTPQRHSREGGNPFITLEQVLSMGPRLRGDDAAAPISGVPANSAISSHARRRGGCGRCEALRLTYAGFPQGGPGFSFRATSCPGEKGIASTVSTYSRFCGWRA